MGFSESKEQTDYMPVNTFNHKNYIIDTKFSNKYDDISILPLSELEYPIESLTLPDRTIQFFLNVNCGTNQNCNKMYIEKTKIKLPKSYYDRTYMPTEPKLPISSSNNIISAENIPEKTEEKEIPVDIVYSPTSSAFMDKINIKSSDETKPLIPTKSEYHIPSNDTINPNLPANIPALNTTLSPSESVQIITSPFNKKDEIPIENAENIIYPADKTIQPELKTIPEIETKPNIALGAAPEVSLKYNIFSSDKFWNSSFMPNGRLI